MGMTLTKEEDAELAPIRKPCYAALGLANDYFSFDREYAEFQDSGKSQTLTNSVWLHMKWHNVDSIVAKEMTRKATRRYEKQFLEMCNEYRRRKAPLSEKLDRYLRALAYQVSGNVVWSLNCPRYHPEFRYDPNAGIEDSLTAEALPKAFQIEYDARLVEEVRDSAGINSSNGFSSDSGHSRRSSTDSSTTVSDDGDSSIRGGPSTSSSVSAYASTSEPKDSNPLDNEDSLLLDTRHVQAPYDYITSLPSKGVRDVFIDALNIWLDVPESIVSHIKSLGRRLHSASLMLDDIEDNSSLRRGQPATHTVFGVAQTINSGCYEILQAVGEARELGTASLDIVLEELAELHVGQSYDLHWTRHGTCPSEDEYLEMVAKKTGGLFRLLARLMFANRADSSPSDHPSDRHLHNDIKNLVELIGTQFQIRDDYQNLQSAEYSAQKGFCEDLDEGKYSFPLIHALACHPNVIRLRELLKRRQDAGSLSGEHKRLVLKELETAGSMEYTEKTLKRLQGQIYADVEKIEKSVGRENWILRALLQKLEV
jgi:geranylgeranyl pyrophosphate synthase